MNTDTNATNAELMNVALVLTDCLERLDRVGAGIAAIHVNAAIEQLASTLGAERVGTARPEDLELAWDTDEGGADCLGRFDPRLIRILPANGPPH
jgi:hypothetical protein